MLHAWRRNGLAALLRPVGTRIRTAYSKPVRSEVDVRSEQAKKAASKRARGAISIDTQMVDGLFAIGFGIVIGGWWAGWFKSKTSEVEQMVAGLRSNNITVLVFELDHVMCGKSSGDGMPPNLVDDYLESVSHEFVEAVDVLHRRGFNFAVAIQTDRPVGGPPMTLSKHGGRGPPQMVRGVELARTLLASRCPQALPSFKVFVEDPRAPSSGPSEVSSRDRQMYKIAEFYGVPMQELMLFCTSEQDTAGKKEWKAALIQDPRAGFRYSDCLGVLS